MCVEKRPACRHHYVRVEQSDSQVSNSSHYMYTVSKRKAIRQPPTYTLYTSPLYQNYWIVVVVVSSCSLLSLLSFFVFFVVLSLSSSLPVGLRLKSVWPPHNIVLAGLQGAKESNVARSHQQRRGGVCDEGGRRAKSETQRRTRVRAESEPQTWRHVTHNNVYTDYIFINISARITCCWAHRTCENTGTMLCVCISTLYLDQGFFFLSFRHGLLLADWKLRTIALSQHQR